MLIRDAEVHGHGRADVRVDGGTVVAVDQLDPRVGEQVIEARGGALFPGLHDHHIHLAGLAVRSASIVCGPPAVTDRESLARALAAPGSGWLRGIQYHESVMGLPSARELDALVHDRPVRIQHRSGRMWLLNSRALDALLANARPPQGLEREGLQFTGRLFDEDTWLRNALASTPPAFGDVSRMLAACGVTGLTDMSPHNDQAMAAHFAAQADAGELCQRTVLAGTLAIAGAVPRNWQPGPAKLHLHEAALPRFEDAVTFVGDAHAQGRVVAIHCVSEVELVFALAAIEAAGSVHGDRIEHASVASPDLVERIATLDLHVCVQPHFFTERGDQYLSDVETRHLPDLYRLRSLALAGIALAGGSDAPFASADPWHAMRAAVWRSTPSGIVFGEDEALDPEAALALYLADPVDLSRQRTVAPGTPADLFLLDRPWSEARSRLASDDVRMTLVSGLIVHDRVDQPPG